MTTLHLDDHHAGGWDWLSLEGGGNWASVEGPAEEWLEVAAALRSGTAVHHKRLALWQDGDGAWFMRSPRNAMSERDQVRIDDREALAAEIDAVLARRGK
ncbi:MAG: hypothetical protein LC119_15145 [Burkholderiales bacterium]|nr:hypothetical protein [Burkholderiales bacterium]